MPRGIAQMMRVGSGPCYAVRKLLMLLTHRKLLQSKAIAIENDLRGTLRNFGLKVGMVGKMKFEARVKELVESIPDLTELVEPLLIVLRALREQTVVLHRRVLAIVRDDEVTSDDDPRCRFDGSEILRRRADYNLINIDIGRLLDGISNSASDGFGGNGHRHV